MSIVIAKNHNKLSDSDESKISAGQMCADNVRGVKGLWVCTGAPTEKSPDGYHWEMNGVTISKKEAIEYIKNKATRGFTDDDRFLEEYIDK